MKYVGKCTRLVSESASYYGSGIHIKASIEKHGLVNFTKEIIEDGIDDKALLSEREKYWIGLLNTKTPNGYNLTDGGEGCPGLPSEVRERIRQHNKLLVGEKSSRYGKKNSEEHNQKIREANLGKTLSNETKEKLKKANLGKKKSKDSIEKTASANRGRKHSDEWNKKVRENQPHALKVSQYLKDGTFVQSFASAIEAYRQTGVNNTSISNCCKGRSKSAGGFIWKFSEDSKC